MAMSFATLFILFGMGTIIYGNHIHKTYIVGQFTAYPEPVADKLRRAIYHHRINNNAQLAVKYYREGIEEAAKCGMDPFSDEIIGVKIQLAFLMENLGQIDRSAEVLEVVLRDCLAWMEDPERGAKEAMRAQKTHVLAKMVGVSVKLGELYADDRIGNQQAAEERLVWAVTTVLKEKERRELEGPGKREEPWMSAEEVGGALESLANHYESHDQHYLAAPLYLQAISFVPTTSCHAITLMNNLSISLALQNPPPTAGVPAPSAASQIDAAKTWARKALATDRALQKAETRTEECDQGCAVTMINMGDFAEMEEDLAEARRWWGEGVELSRRVGFQEGVMKGKEALARANKRK
ncbi:MAG: hypothetical protein Q9195_003302 [Heterodermia aff. obscurata]